HAGTVGHLGNRYLSMALLLDKGEGCPTELSAAAIGLGIGATLGRHTNSSGEQMWGEGVAVPPRRCYVTATNIIVDSDFSWRESRRQRCIPEDEERARMPTPARTKSTAHGVAAGAIDRERLVNRHNPVLRTASPTATLSVGNGDCALTVDVSGLQTFPALHALRPDPHRALHDGRAGLPDHPPRTFDAEDYQIPIQTQSTWAWYATRPNRPLRYDDAITVHEGPRGPVPYADRMGLQRAGDPIPDELEAGDWFHFNPRLLLLGRLYI